MKKMIFGKGQKLSRRTFVVGSTAAAAGTLVPLGLRAANIDPALASSVFITTMTDVFGFFSFLGLATLFAQYLPRVP